VTITLYAGAELNKPTSPEPASTPQPGDDSTVIEGRWICTKAWIAGNPNTSHVGTELVIHNGQLKQIGSSAVPAKYSLSSDPALKHLDFEIETGLDDPLMARRIEPFGDQAGTHRNIYQLMGDTLELGESTDCSVRPGILEDAVIRRTYRRMKPRTDWQKGESFSHELLPSIGARIADANSEIARRSGVDRQAGVVIVGVMPGSAAERSGILANDVIVSFDDILISDSREFAAVTRSFLVNDQVALTILRDNIPVVVEVTLQKGYAASESVTALKQAANRGESWAQFSTGNHYQWGLGIEEIQQKAAEWYRKAAEQNDPEAQAFLASMYENGQGVERSLEKAVDLYRKAADAGVAKAQVDLGNLYLSGRGVGKDGDEAFRLYRLAASHHDPRGFHNLGVCYRDGVSVEKDLPKAKELFTQAAALGQVESFNCLAEFRLEGMGVERDLTEGMRLVKVAADAGNASAQATLGHAYLNGRGVVVDAERAMQLFRVAAEKDHAPAQRLIGWMYETGRAVDQDFDQAMVWYQKAASQKDPHAYYRIGYLIQYGRGVTQAFDKALGWYRAAARSGSADAETAIGTMHEEGQGVARDYQEAIRQYEKARQMGNGWGVYRLARMYWNGSGVEKSPRTDLLKEAIRLGEEGDSNYLYALALEEEARLGTSPHTTEERQRLIIQNLRRAAESGVAGAADRLKSYGVQP